jgi:nicotinate-nucleotide adenylyltransferase
MSATRTSFTAPPKVTEPPLGILGGTFDPVHAAHLRLAAEAMRQLHLGGVLWIPAGHPRHRAAPAVSAEHRLAMVRLATQEHPEYLIDEAEIRSADPSYTVPTLERLRRIHGENRPLVLLMGADAFLGLASWHRWRELFRLAHIGVVSRPTFDLAANDMNGDLADEFGHRHSTRHAALATVPAGAIVTFTMDAGTVSSTEVRARLRQGAPVDELLPAPVLDYIRHHRLYLS